MTRELAETKLESINEEINVLIEQRRNITQFLRESDEARVVSKILDWNLTEGSCLVCFAKLSTNTLLVKMLRITGIDTSRRYVRGVIGDYYTDREDCSETWYKSERSWISFDALYNMLDEYNMYLIDEDMFEQLCLLTSCLNINSQNINNYVNNCVSRGVNKLT